MVTLVRGVARRRGGGVAALLVVGSLLLPPGVMDAGAEERDELRVREERAAALVEALGNAEPQRVWWALDAKSNPQDPQSVASLRAELKKLEASAVPALLKALDSNDPRVRGRAALTLAEMGPVARPAIPRLVEQLADETDYSPERVAGKALARLGAPAAPALRDALRNSSSRVRWRACLALGSIRPVGAESAAALVDCLRDDDSSTVVSAARMLSHMGEPVVTPLVALLEADTRNEFIFACDVAGRLGPQARAALPVLRTKSGAPGTYGEYVNYAILSIDIETVCSQALSDNPETSARARWILAQARWTKGCTVAEAARALETLRKLLGEPDAGVRERAVRGLCATSPWASQTVPLLLKYLTDSRETIQVRLAAIDAWKTLGEEGRAALPVLRRLANEDVETLAAAAQDAIERWEMNVAGRK